MSHRHGFPLSSGFVDLSPRLVTDPSCSIVIVHGLQGHPYKTWACKAPRRDVPSTAGSSVKAPDDGNSSRNPYHRVIPIFSGKFSGSPSGSEPSQKSHSMSKDGGDVKESKVYWPLDLLPVQYPNARVLVYGYDTRVTKYLAGPTNENSIFSHGKDLLSSLAMCRKLDTPLILIAHSLGGIVVKEMLASSSNSSDSRLKNVVTSISAVIFLGTPHRGSGELATLGDRARSMISAFRMKTNPAILDALRLKTKDLERAQEAFSTVWSQYDFRVKTFQEGLGLTGLNFGPFGKKVVPDFSSLLGDVRERAETIQANHMEMCRFTGLDDPNYERLCGEITLIYDWLAGFNATTANRADKHSLTAKTLAISSRESREGIMDEREKTCLQSLLFPRMNQRTQSFEKPAEGTCSWFFKHDAFVDWLTNKNQTKSCGLLWLRGKPGSGKSTLLKEAFSRAMTEMSASEYHVASFFFDAKGEDLEHSPTGMLRSVLHQMCSQNPNLLRTLLSFAQERRALCGEDMAPWEEAELRAFVRLAIIDQKKRIIIFIDAIDECDSSAMRDVADFWRETTKMAHHAGVELSVCLSSRHFPAIAVNDCPEIVMENHNHPDIVEFVRQRLDLGLTGKHADQQAIQQKILEKSGGVFLWVSLVVKDVLRKNDEGKGLRFLLKHLDSVPRELEDLFSQLLTAGQSSTMIVRMFQWALLPTKPLRLHEWHHVLAFIGDTPPSSLHQWRQSDNYTETDEQLEKRITHLSRGLIGFNDRLGSGYVQEPADESMSDRAGAGSLDLSTGETRVVQVIHESVRQYFMNGPGFAVLNPGLTEKPLAHAHLSMMKVCLDYTLIRELDALVEARMRPKRKVMRKQNYRFRYGSFRNVDHDSSTMAPRMPFDPWGSLPASPTGVEDIPYETHQSRAPSRPDSPASVASFGSASSHGGRQTPLAFEPEDHFGDGMFDHDRSRKRSRLPGSSSPAPPGMRGNDDELPVYKKLKESSGPVEAYNIARWSSRDSLVGVRPDSCYDEFAALKSPQASITGYSEVLEDYPALLSYATFEIFTHAQKADAENLDPRHIIELFQSHHHRWQRWQRWRALREDVHHDVELLDFLADLGLSSWLKAEGVWKPWQVLHAMERAIKHGHLRALRNLLDAFPSIGYGGFIARLSASATNATMLQAFISQHPSQVSGSTDSIMALKGILESKDKDGRTALHLAAVEQKTDSVSLLLEYGTDVNAVDLMLRTPLHLVCMNRSSSANRPSSGEPTRDDNLARRSHIINLLLDHDADIDAADKEGRTPLMVACSNSHLPSRQDIGDECATAQGQPDGERSNVIEVLLERGADVMKGDRRGFLPLHEACRNSSGGRQSKVSIVRKLLDFGSPVNAAGVECGTPLHIACYHSDIETVEELLRRGAYPSLRDYDGRMPLHIAAAKSTEQVVETLLSSPLTFVGAEDGFGSTPLHLACDTRPVADQNTPRRLSVIRRLLAHGARAYTPRDQSGNLPVDLARRNGFEEALKLLAEDSCDAPRSYREPSEPNDQLDC